ncbi:MULTISPECIES: MFS transporter [unclassified Cryobacterium]|uniref:MFS transporter n=2 Tax=Cryobacterium TaxID=69578 RepID=UPI002AB561EC|nr:MULTISPECIES: MFS transporter [unclassified Cryobacterium]MDY7527293.1 MFS transporter [Cryobacterium sp. 10C2]MDY7556920.1 MFS transporter [Cryobacterium sp. 10C3]MEB0003391.1 MFS transporter [Cryobacterium sp. RTC2.1]MEB0201365.1 MFS transporter [Cryobacterium sp. 5I3]MEB0285837.1 MFS transporter [Cryobacterium sp. 10S3]
MNPAARRVQRIYLILLLGNTLAASFIWGINTLFLLDAGLSNFEAFAANAFFTAGMVLFEIPTGVVADTVGRKASYLLGTITLSATTALYWLLWLWHAPFGWWALVSVLLGLGFTFFSGAVDAWLVDALTFSGYTDGLEAVFGRGLVVTGIAMFAGSVLGGVIAQATNLGVPFLLRAGVLVVMLVFAAVVMKDLGFTPDRSQGPLKATRTVLAESIEHGLRRRSVRWVILSAPFASGVGVYAFYALQPYLLVLSGDPSAYSIAGLAAAVLSLAQVAGGVLAPRIRGVFHRRTTTVIGASVTSIVVLIALGLTSLFWLAIVLLVLWGFVFAVAGPVRQAYLNDMIPSKQRATVLSFDSLFGSLGGVFVQPALGRAADLWGYGTSLVIGGLIELIGIPFLFASRRQRDPADTVSTLRADAAPQEPEAH